MDGREYSVGVPRYDPRAELEKVFSEGLVGILMGETKIGPHDGLKVIEEIGAELRSYVGSRIAHKQAATQAPEEE